MTIGKQGFQPGNKYGRLSSRNKYKLQNDVLKALEEDFAQFGPAVVKICRIEKPIEYLKAIISILPKDVVIDTGVLGDLSDEELAAHISLLQKLKARQIDGTVVSEQVDSTVRLLNAAEDEDATTH